jgi:hypothetical protein
MLYFDKVKNYDIARIKKEERKIARSKIRIENCIWGTILSSEKENLIITDTDNYRMNKKLYLYSVYSIGAIIKRSAIPAKVTIWHWANKIWRKGRGWFTGCCSGFGFIFVSS